MTAVLHQRVVDGRHGLASPFGASRSPAAEADWQAPALRFPQNRVPSLAIVRWTAAGRISTAIRVGGPAAAEHLGERKSRGVKPGRRTRPASGSSSATVSARFDDRLVERVEPAARQSVVARDEHTAIEKQSAIAPGEAVSESICVIWKPAS
jgi:hypothetical protein